MGDVVADSRAQDAKGHVLLVSFHYLDGSSEGLCAARTVRALAARGWRVTVIAGAAGASGGEVDAAVEVLRVEGVPSGWRSAWAQANRRAGEGFPQRVASAGLNLLFGCTAEEWTWAVAASRLGIERLGRADAPVGHVFSRLNPMVSHLAAERILAARPDLPWTAYFSDPWPYFLYPAPYTSRSGRLYRRRAVAMARRICARADALLFPSKRLADSLESIYRLETDRVFVAPHMGPRLDEGRAGLPDGETSTSTADELVLRHAGYLMKERRVDGLFEGLLQLDDSQRAGVRVEFMGRRAAGIEVPVELENIVEFLPSRSPEAARRWMAAADVALLVEADCEEGIFLPSKFAEYVVEAHPMLCLSPARGTIADYLADGGGLRVGPSDAAGIAAALRELLIAKREGRLGDHAPGPSLRRQFQPDVVVQQVEQALEAARMRRR